MNHTLYGLLKKDLRASIALARNYRLSGERRLAVQFMNDAAQTRSELITLRGC
ncbi:hypothetical protein [Photobacterium swingsii]|uniref:hypothetical protein n=1 Tax=Photobacterium swingsii TaxID=680026 RepID=UPI0040685681